MNLFHNLFRFCVLVFVLAGLILGPTIYSQEATPEIQPTEAMQTPVDSPTSQPSTEISPPTSEDTVVPTATPTATATALENTAAPSPSQESFPTETQTEPATAIPTATTESPGSLLPPEPPLTQVFRDNFESSDDHAWLLGTGWSISPYADGSVLMAVGTVTPTQLLVDPLANVVITFRYQTDAGVFTVHARANNGDGYALHVNPLGQIQLDRNGSIMASAALPTAVSGTWRTLRFSLIDTTLQTAVDGIPLIAVQDSALLPAGNIEFSSDDNLSTPLVIDDFEIYVPTNTVLPTEIPTILATATLVPLPPPPSPSPDVSSGLTVGCDYNVPAGDRDSLIAAIDAANGNLVAETICLGGGTYTLDVVNNTTFITIPPSYFSTASDNGLPLITSELTIEGNGSTIIRAAESPRFRLFEIGLNGALTLRNLTLSGGEATAGTGAIYVGGHLSVENSTLIDNVGALYVGATGVLTLTDTDVMNNHGGLENRGTTTVSGGTFSGHTSGAIHNANTLSINGTTFEDNGAGASDGGAIRNDALLTITDGHFLSNTTSLYGGAIYNRGGITEITDSVFRLNSVTDAQYGHGSVIYAHPSGSVTITNSCIADNTSNSGLDVDHGNATVVATNNWWGAADGPSGVGSGSGDSVFGTYIPFLTSPILGCTATPLVALGQSVNVNGTNPLEITLSASGGIPPYTFELTQLPAHGTLTGTGASLTYTAFSGFSGVDSFDFTVTDSDGQQATATVQVFVDVPPTSNITVNSIDQEQPFVTNGNCTLGEAIQAANTNSAVDGCAAGSAITTDVIDLMTGTYTLTTSAVEVPAADRTGLPQISTDIVINGNSSTIQRGDHTFEFRLMQVLASGNLTLNDLTLTRGVFSATNRGGGAIQAFGNLTLNDVNVQNNRGPTSASAWGGGIAMQGSAALTINGGTFSDNSRLAIYGVNGSITIHGAVFTHNADGAVSGGHPLNISNSTFDSNGGAVAGSSIDISASSFTNNTGTGGFSAISVKNGSLSLSNSVIRNNVTSNYGGAVYIYASQATLTNNIVIGNQFSTSSTTYGGGVYIADTVGVPVTTSNVTINGSCIAGNTPFGIKHASQGTLNAQNNWWGASDGPSGIGNGGGEQLVSTTASFIPFLTSPISAACDYFYPPVASDQLISVVYQTSQAVPLAVKGGIQPFTVVIDTPPAHGTLSDIGLSPLYSPDAGSAQTDSFTYHVVDAQGKSSGATVTIQIISTLSFASRAFITYQLPFDFTLDSTGGEQPITYSVLSDPTNGTVSGTSPDFTFDSSDPNFTSDIIEFRATDAAGFSQDAIVEITLLPPLEFYDQIVHVAPGETQGFTLSASGGMPPYTYTISTPTLGTLTGTAPYLIYTFNPEQSGTEILSVTVTDANNVTDEGTVTITSTPQLIAHPPYLTTPFNHAVTGTLQAEGGTPPYTFMIVMPPESGTISGTLPDFTYTPDSDYEGVDTFYYQVTDTDGNTDVAIVFIIIGEKLRLSDETLMGGFEASLEFSLHWTGGEAPFTYTIGTPSHGTVPGTPPDLIYTPNLGFSGTDTFTISVEDGVGATASALVTVQINDPFTVATGDVGGLISAIEAANAQVGSDVITLAGGTYSLNQAYPDVEVGNSNGLPRITDALEIRGNGATIDGLSTRRIFMIASDDSLVLKDLMLVNGQTSMLAPNQPTNYLWAGGAIYNQGDLSLDNVVITGGRAYRGGGIINFGSLVISAGRLIGNTGVNMGGAVYNAYAASLTANGVIFANNNSPIGSAVSNAEVNASAVVSGSCIAGNTNFSVNRATRAAATDFRGNWWGNPSGPEVPQTAGTGIGDKVGFEVDVSGFLTSPTLGCPQANDQALRTAHAKPIAITLSGTGTAPLIFSIVSVNGGTMTGTPPNIVYTPSENTVGTARSIFRVTDANSLSAVGFLDIAVATDLLAENTNVSTSPDTPINLVLSASGGTTPYTFSITDAPAHGILTGSAPNLTYTPNSGYVGADSLTYQVTDTLGDSATGTILIGIGSLRAVDQTLTIPYAATLDVLLSAQGGSTPYTFAVLTQPSHGILFGNPPDVVYVPNTGYSGADSFTFSVTDSRSSTTNGTISITVGAASGTAILVNSTLQEIPFANNGNCTLGEAIQAANTDRAIDACTAGQGADTILLPAGTYQFIGAAQGTRGFVLPQIESDITIRGAGIGQTVLEPIVTDLGVFDNYSSFTLESVTIRNANVDTYAAITGAAIQNRGHLVVNGSRFEFNTGQRGAAIYSENPASTQPVPSVRVINSEFFRNTSTDGLGGALYGRDGSTLEVFNSLFQQNNALLLPHGTSIWWGGPAQANGNCLLDVAGSGGSVITYGVGQGQPPSMDATLNWWGVSGTAVSAVAADTVPTLSQRPAICGSPTPPPLVIPTGDENALIAALNYANSQTGTTTTITLAQNGTYGLTHTFSSANGVSLLPPLNSRVIINANGATLTRSTSTAARFFTVDGRSLTLNNITITNGVGTGGAVFVFGNGTLIVHDSSFRNNGSAIIIASGAGGALAGSDATITVTGSTFEQNYAARGGAVYAGNTVLELESNVFTRNSANLGSSVLVSGTNLVRTARNNCFLRNDGYSVAKANNPGENTVTYFHNNWWGAADGPGGSGTGSGDQVNPFVVYQPFLTAPPSACPSSTPLTTSNQVISTLSQLSVPILLTASGGQPNYTFTIIRQPSHGLLSGIAPVLRYTPSGTFSGTDSFDFTVRDSANAQVSGVVTIHVIAVVPSATVVPNLPTPVFSPTAVATVQPTPTQQTALPSPAVNPGGGVVQPTPTQQSALPSPAVNSGGGAVQPPASSINRRLPRPFLVSPSGIDTTSSTTPAFEWHAVELAERYEIQITKTTTFLRDLVQDEMVRTTSLAAPEMQDGVYLWRVRAVDAQGDVSLWSDVRRLTVDTVAPQAPNLVSPSEHSVSSNLQPTFRWSKVPDAYRYQVVLSVDSECPSVDASEPLRGLWFRPHDPLSQGTYYWCVLAIDAAGNVSMPDDIWEVVVNIATAPEDGEIIIRQEEGYSPLLRWSYVPGATSYTIQIARDASLTDATEFEVGARTSYRLEDRLPYGIYYWQVIPDNLPQETPVVSRFTISPPLLSAPIQQPPVADESSAAGAIVLSWGDVDGAASYEVEITTENRGIIVTASTDVPHYDFSEPVDASDETIYRWRVRAINAYEVAGEWSGVNNVT